MSALRRTLIAAARSARTTRARAVTRSNVAAAPIMAQRFASTTPGRSEKFARLTKEHITDLRSFLSSSSSLLTTVDGSSSPEDLASYNSDWLNKYHGKSQVVVKPKSTEEVSKVMKYCYENDIAIVPQGGNTGLVGGSMPVHDELIMSLGNLQSVRSFDPVSGILVADAGMVLETADGYLADQGFIFPLDLGAKGSCHVGGVVATNAGGLRFLRYGSLHGSVLGLEVVLPDGTIWNGLSKLRKDNTGYDLKQLFIGSEGTIGIITAVSILCPRRSASTNVAVFSLPSYEHVLKMFGETKSHLGEILSAFEMFDAASYKLVKDHHRENGDEPKKVFDQEGAFYVLVETSGSNADHDEEKLGGLIEHLMESEIVLDGVLAQDATQTANLWALREGITEACSKMGVAYKYDLSTAPAIMYKLVEQMREKLTSDGLLKEDGTGSVKTVVGFSHLGDGNLHLNIVGKEYSEDVKAAIEPYVYEIIAAQGGSISAEHGLGLMKAPYVSYSQSPTSIDMMRRIKTMFDPKGLLNPYKYIQ